MKIPAQHSQRLNRLRGHRFAWATVLNLGLLLIAAAVALLLGWITERGVAAWTVLALYLVAATVFTALRMPRVEDPPDPETHALEAFAATPLGALMADNRETVAKARRAVGRQASMYQPLDRMVRAIRKIERQIAALPERPPELARLLTRELPLIATTATQYCAIKDEAMTDAQAGRLLAAEGVLRDSAQRLEEIARGGVVADRPAVGIARLDAHAEVLAEYMATDIDSAGRRAAGARAAHALRAWARQPDTTSAEEANAIAVMIEAATQTDSPGFETFNASWLLQLTAALEAGDACEVEGLLAGIRATIEGTEA